MDEREVNAIAGRLSLRDPQRASLELLARVTAELQLAKTYDIAAALTAVQRVAPSVTDFERAFPSLCFALATGVGKTRLMGAFIAYLYRAHGLKHFFVLAPNLTIYEKLKADFTPNTPKYVFPGLGDITENLVLITGDDWEDGRGVRESDLYRDSALHVNVFNVAKINTEVRGGAAPRMKRLHEVIGDSYFDYLSKLDDLVLVMDESHRYRAQAGARAVEGLKPILGLELTATPQTVRGARTTPFLNVAYNYPLANAIEDGFVKEPAVATRSNFDASDYSEAALERLKLEDGMQLHELTKVELVSYAAARAVRVVKPFVLVVAEDTSHAESVKALIEGADFCEGRYAGRVIIVHSNQTGEIKDENLTRLLNVEDPAEPTEVVIHVNKLGEGWDVTNLYTIIPLRAANSPNLVEQSLGRGLRLPYGRRTGVEAVDKLTVVAHDKFQAIVDHARRPGSVLRAFKQVMIDAETATPLETIRSRPLVDTLLESPSSAAPPTPVLATRARPPSRPSAPVDLRNDEERAFARLAVSVATDRTVAMSWQELGTEEGRERLAAAVRERAPEVPETLGIDGAALDTERVIGEAIRVLETRTIPIPHITMRPKGTVRTGFSSFVLDTSGIRNQPLSQEILVQALQSEAQARIATGVVGTETRLENYIVRELADDPSIAYEHHAALLYELAEQLTEHLRSYLRTADAVENVLVTQGRALAAQVRWQLMSHRIDEPVEYEIVVSGDVHKPRDVVGSVRPAAELLDFRAPVVERSQIRRMRFGGFARCLFAEQRFDSDAERRLAVILENDSDETLKWFKPAIGDVRIWLRGGEAYNPDFVVETKTKKYLIEPKANDEMSDPLVQEKARAARVWCDHASEWERSVGGKEWQYLLVPDTSIVQTATLSGLTSQFA